MTLIAMYSIKGSNTFMIGDVLVSVPEGEHSPDVKVPTTDTPFVYSKGQRFKPNRLLQKLVLLGANVVFGWSGSRPQATEFVKYLRQNFGDRRISLEEANRVLNDYPEEELDKIAGFLTLDIGYDVGSFDINIIPDETGRMGKLWIAGSGEDDFRWFADAQMEFSDQDKSNNDIVEALTFMGGALARQASFGYGLSNSWGGGFQVALRGPAGFYLLDKILVRAWIAVNEGGTISLKEGPAFYLFYHNQFLLVCRLFGTDGGTFGFAAQVDKDERLDEFPYGTYYAENTVDLVQLESGPLHASFVSTVPSNSPINLIEGEFRTFISKDEEARLYEASCAWIKSLDPSRR